MDSLSIPCDSAVKGTMCHIISVLANAFDLSKVHKNKNILLVPFQGCKNFV